MLIHRPDFDRRAREPLPGASFLVNGATPPHDSALTSVGAEYRLANGIALLGKFDGEFGSHIDLRRHGHDPLHVVTKALWAARCSKRCIGK
jgi:hypothetical protein